MSMTLLEYKIAQRNGGNFSHDGKKGFIVKEQVVSAQRAFILEPPQGGSTLPNYADPNYGAQWAASISNPPPGNIVYKNQYTFVSMANGSIVIIKETLDNFKTAMGL